MAKLAKFLQGVAGAAGGEALNVEDVFSTYLYTGNGSTQTITNGIDLAGEGGLVWIKARDGGAQWSRLYDTERGGEYSLVSSDTTAQLTGTGPVTFNSDSFVIGSNNTFNVNYLDRSYASWTFRKAPKFFDVVTYTGDGVAGREIAHNLGTTVGTIIVKKTDSALGWAVYHKDTGNTKILLLNDSGTGFTNAAYWNNTSPTDTNFTVGASSYVNGTGGTYVAYLFAHNDGDGDFGPNGDQDIIKCGSYTGTGGSGVSINLEWEPQWVLIKRATGGTANWHVWDSMRGIVTGGNDNILFPDVSSSENTGLNRLDLSSTGFEIPSGNNSTVDGSGDTYIYIAIRRGPMAVPESATDVFDVATRDATPPAFNTSFDVDMALYQSNVTSPDDTFNSARIMQGDVLKTNTTDNAISGGTGFVFDYSNGWYGSTSANSNAYAWMWGRAPNFFDVVCNTAVASSDLRIDHNLGVEPEMIWTKQRDAPTYTDGWYCYHKDIGTTGYIRLDSSAAKNSVVTLFNSPSSTDFGLDVNAIWDAGTELVHYLFASLAGISKVGSYTGNGSSQTIDCGFSSGARLVIIKGLTVATPWLLYDSARGIVSGNDPYITLNAKSGSSTTDYIDPDSSGFIVNNNVYVNNNGSDYIFYAIA